MEDQAKNAESQLKERFGEQVEVEYIDIYSPASIETVQKVMLLVMSGQAALPVTLIDSEPKIGGAISISMIEEELESLGTKPKKGSR